MEPKQKFPSYKFEQYHDKGHAADPLLSNLFPAGGDYKVKRLSPKLGSVITGIQLSQLSDAAKNDLSRFVAERGVVVFRDQDFNQGGPQAAVEFAQYFGHCTSMPRVAPQKGSLNCMFAFVVHHRMRLIVFFLTERIPSHGILIAHIR